MLLLCVCVCVFRLEAVLSGTFYIFASFLDTRRPVLHLVNVHASDILENTVGGDSGVFFRIKLKVKNFTIHTYICMNFNVLAI
jgi:hypothetical protein